MSPSHSLTLKDVLGQVQVKVVRCHLQQTGRASCSSWTGKGGHSALSKAGQAKLAAQAQVGAGCTPCQSQHGGDKKSPPPHLSFTPSLSLAESHCWPKCRLMSAVFGVRCAKAFSTETTTITLFVKLLQISEYKDILLDRKHTLTNYRTR